jgi:sugar phosphate isomerase/epimerase
MNLTHQLCLVLGSGALLGAAPVLGAEPIPPNCLTGGLAIGCQAWTFNKFTVLEAIDKTADAGGKVIELFPGQKLSPDQDVKLDQHAAAEVIQKVQAKLAQRGVKAVNFGVTAIPADEAQARQLFEFAKKLGLYGLTTESVDALPTIDKLVKEYDIKVGIHNHPRQPNDPNYKVWDPNYVLSMVKDLDPRIGAAADTGHWLRSGLNPVACLKILQGRVISAHLKDLNEKSAAAHDVPYGTGIANLPGILDELKRQGFAGNVAIEYEHNWDNNVPEVAQCIGFVRGYGAH